MKITKKSKMILTVLLTLTVTIVFAQSPADNFDNASVEADGFIDDVVKWGVRAVYSLMYLLAIAKILPIFFSQQGEDKLSRAGWWLFLLGFAVIATIIAESLFQPS